MLLRHTKKNNIYIQNEWEMRDEMLKKLAKRENVLLFH